MINRRQFINWSSLLAGWAALPGRPHDLHLNSKHLPQARSSFASGRVATLLPDGSFQREGLGWQLGLGSRLVTLPTGPSRKALEVAWGGSSTTRAIILSPEPGKIYTVHGLMRTQDVQPLEPGGCAVMSLNQFEFQGRPVGEQDFAKLTGTHNWTPFSYSFKCEPLVVWFELSLGLYRAEGKAWFGGVTLVEGSKAYAISGVFPRLEDPGYPSPQRQTLASVAVLRDHFPPAGSPSNPEMLGLILKEAGYDVEYLTADKLSDPEHFTRDRFDILLLPYGPSFPAPAQGALEQFLSRGGSFFSTGGYAFNTPLLRAKSDWIGEEEALAADPGVELVREGDFESDLQACESSGWKHAGPECCSLDKRVAHQGLQSASVTHDESGWWKEAWWEYEVGGMRDRDRFYFSCWAKTEGVSDRYDGFAYINLEQLDSTGEPIYVVKKEVVRLRGTNGWHRYERETVANPDTRRIRIRFGLSKAYGSLWVDQVSLRKKFPEIRINTAKGFPNDELRITPQQIGVFDADYRLRRVSSLSTAPGQEVVKSHFRFHGAVTGYAASGVLGTNHARWIPLLNAYDHYGRLRGAAGALMRHYNGYYRKSHWAFFGVDNRDLFDRDRASAKSLLLEVFDALRRKTFLHEVRTNYASYRQGEGVRVFTWASNFSSRKRKVTATITITGVLGGKIAFRHTLALDIEADETVPVQTRWKPGQFEERRYDIRIELAESGRKIDVVETGFIVWDDQVLRKGFPLEYSGNYLRAGTRAIFMQGSDDYIHTFINRFESPATWYRDIAKYRDHFLTVYENLMGTRGLDDVPPVARWRQIDAMVQICQQLKTVFFPGLLIFGDTAVSNRDLKHQQRFCKAFAARYGQSSGLIYYLNGDLRLRNPNLPDLRRLFNDYLKQKYGDERHLTEAWHVSPPHIPLGSIPPLGGTERWDDVRTYDNFRFRVNVVRRWLDAMARSIREVDPNHPITAEFYQTPADGIDVVTAIGTLTLANIGYFDVPGEDLYRFPQAFRFIDLRARGKSINDGEFGVKTHPAWKDAGGYLTTRSETEENQLYLAIPHYAVGLGGSKVQNWCWKYPADLPFEWGINYPCDLVSRDALLFYRNTGLFFRQFDLHYQSPELFFLIADNHRMGGLGGKIQEAQLNAIRFLLDLHSNFAATDEFHLNSLPPSCKVLIYPLPFCPDDATLDRILAFVKSGGALYVSGDISYDPERNRTRTRRLSELCGVDFEGANYPNIAFEGHKTLIVPSGHLAGLRSYQGFPCIRIRSRTAELMAHTTDGRPVIVTNRVGRGRVFYSTDVLELHAPARTTDLGRMVYGSFLEWVGFERLAVDPDDPRIHYFRSTTSEGDELHTLINRDESAPIRQVRLETRQGTVSLDIARRMTGAVAVTKAGAVQSIEASGMAKAKGTVYCEADLHMMLLSLDGKDLRESDSICLLPMGEGKVRIRRKAISGSQQLQVGEFKNAHWTSLEDHEIQIQDGWLELDVNQVRNLSIVLLAPAGKMNSAVNRLTNLLELRFPS